jgi:hypothetical protein
MRDKHERCRLSFGRQSASRLGAPRSASDPSVSGRPRAPCVWGL